MVVVSHDRVAELRRCLESLDKSEGRESLQIIVVDNGSRDGSARLDADFPRVQFIRLPKNFGLTKAMNIGWRAADSPYVFFLHEDTEVEPQAAIRLAEALDANPDAAAACPLLVDAEGRPAPQLGDLPPDAIFHPAQPESADPQPVEYPRGAALMMRVFTIKAVRQIDERYGQSGADADLAIQIRRASKRILLVPAARVMHRGSKEKTDLERADVLQGQAVFMDKYAGFVAGLRTRVFTALRLLFTFQWGILRHILASRKIDGAQ
jgi:GT2 family glycosyltransferase